MTDRPKPQEVQGPDPAQFRVPASDAKGHNTRLYFRAQPGHAKELEAIVSSRNFPYRSKGDVLRHAFVRHLKWLNRQVPMKSVTGEVDAILEVMRDDEFSDDFKSVLDKASERITAHLGSGSIGEARRLVLKIMAHVNQMPDGYWRSKYAKDIKDRFGHILSEAQSARLGKSKIEQL
jgi:hypothetical protein